MYVSLLLSFQTIAQTPAFNASLSGTCVPVAVKFTDVSKIPGNIVSRIWNFGDGNTGTFAADEIEAGHNYITDGEFAATLTLVMEDGRQFVSNAKTIIIKPTPIAAFDASTLAGCAPLDVTFTDKSTSSSGAITKWQWDFGDGSSTAKNPTHLFSDKKDFIVSLIVYNEYNCKSEVAAKEIVNVFDPAKAVFNSGTSGSCSFPFAVNFSNTSTGKGSISYSWDFGDGQTSTDKNPQHEFQAAGFFNVKLTVNNGTSCASSTTSGNIYIGTPNVSILHAPLIACTGKSVNYAATVSPASLVQNITWYFPDNSTTAVGASADHVFSSNDTYLIKVKAASAINCTSEATSATTVKPSPVALFQATPTHLCKSPFAIGFDNISNYTGAGYEYVWDFGDGQFSTLENPQHTYASATSKYVTFTIKDNTSGCESSPLSQYVDLREPSVTLNVVPQQGCKPLVIQATATANANEQIVSYTWDWGDNTSSTTTTNTANHFYVNEGSYIAKVEIATENGCSAISNGISVQVNDYCSDDGSVSKGSATSSGFSFLNTCENKNTITFTDDFSKRTDNDYAVLSWDFGDGTTGGGENPVTHIYTGSGTREYNVTVTRKDELTGEISTSTKRIVIIDEKPLIYLTKTATCTETQIPFRTSGIHAQYIKQYVWNFGDKSTKTINNSLFDPTEDGYTTHMYSSNGKYLVSLKITDKLGCTNELRYPDTIRINGPQADFDAPDILSCKEIDFTKPVADKSIPNASVPIDKWEWYIWRTGDSQPATPTLSYSKDNIPEKILLPLKNTSAAAEYSVKLVVTDVDKCKSAPKTISRLIKSYWPNAHFSVSRDSICGNRNVNFYNGSTTSSGAVNTWFFGDGSSSSLSSPAHAYAEDVYRYSVTLIVAEQNMPMCKDTITKENLIRIVKPVADFDISDLNECPPLAVNCTNKSVNAGQNMWTFSEGSNSSQTNISGHIYDIGGDYTIKLHVEGVDGCVDEITKPVHIKGPAGKLQYENTVGCTPFDFQMKVVDSKNVSNYSWDFGDGTLPVDPSACVQTHVYTLPRKYLPNVIISSDDGCHISLAKEDSVIVDKVSATFQLGSLHFCGKGSVLVTEVSAVSALSDIESYRWKVNDELISDEEHPTTFNCSAPGKYEVALTVDSKYGCEAVTSEKINVSENPVVSINGGEIICLEKDVASLDYSPAITCPDAIESYKWIINDSLISINEYPNVNYRQTGIHDLKLIVTTVNGCVDSSARKIIIDSVRANFTISENSVCGENRNIFFTNTSALASHVAEVKWDFGDGSYSSASGKISHDYHIYGDVKTVLSITTENGCTDKSDTDTIHLYQSPTVNIKGSDLVCLTPGSPSLQYIANVISPDAIEVYKWLINDSAIVNKEQLLTDYREPGKHHLKLIATTINGCVDSCTKNIFIDSVHANLATSENSVCGENRNIFFTNISTLVSRVAEVKWDFGDGNFSDAKDTISHNYNIYGDVKTALSVTTENGCVDKSDPIIIHLYQSPIVSIKGDDVICLSPGITSLKYSADVVSVDAVESYRWLINDSSVTNGKDVNFDYRTSGAHDLKLIATTINGCVDSVTNKIIIDSVRANFSLSADTVCGKDRNIFFTNTSTLASKIADVKWDFGDGNYSEVKNIISHNYNVYGDIKTALSITTENGCTDKMDTITIHLYQSPIVNIKGNNVICLSSDSASGIYQPDIISTDSIQSYSWRINGALLSDDEILRLNYRQTGKHDLALIATTEKGCSDSAMMTITIDSVKAGFLVLDSVRCGAGNVRVVSTSSSVFPITSYLWSLGDSIYQDRPQLIHYYNEKGNHPVSLTVVTENNCRSSLIKENAVGIYENPTIALSADKESCLNKAVDFVAVISSDDKITSHQWMVNNAPVKGAVNNASKMFSDTGNYIISYKAISAHGCADSSLTSLVVHPLPLPAITPDTTICRGSEITLRVAGADTYVWKNVNSDNIANRTGASLSVKPLTSTNYYLTATNMYNCSITDSVFVTVDRPVDLSVCDTQTICKGSKIQLSAAGNTSLFVWDNHSSLSSSVIASPIVSPVTSTAYNVTGVSRNVCPDETKSVIVNVVDNPAVSLGPDITVPAGNAVTLHASASGNIRSYLWDFPMASKCVSCKDLSFIADQDATIVLHVFTQEGCTASDTIAVHILCNKDAVFVPTAFTPNNDGTNDVFYIMGHGLKKIKSLRIFDRWGRLVFHNENCMPNDRKAGWNGMVAGRPINQSSTFVYIVDAICQEDKNIQLKGTVLLIR